MIIRLLVAATFALAAMPVLAQDRLGGFDGSVAGEPRAWHVLDIDGEASAGWYDQGMIVQVEVFGFPRADSIADVVGAIDFTLTLMGGSLAPAGASLTYYADGTRQLFLAEEDEIQVTLDEARRDGDRLHLRGTIEAEVFRVVNLFREELDRDNGRAVAARFDLVLDAR